MGQLRDKMQQDLKLRGYKSATARKYLEHVHKFVAQFIRCPTPRKRMCSSEAPLAWCWNQMTDPAPIRPNPDR